MPIAQKPTKADAYLKVMCWGEPGAGKTRLALSFPAPLVIDLERGSRLYADQFDFLVAEPTTTMPGYGLVKAIIDEITHGEYPDRKTLVIDPITDYLDQLEWMLIEQKRKAGINLDGLKGPLKAKFYADIKDGTRERLNVLLNLPMNIVFVAREKNEWGKGDDGKMAAIGKKADASEIIEYLCDIVINLKRGGVGQVKKSRLGDLPDTIKAITYQDIKKALETGATPATIESKLPIAQVSKQPAPTT